ncbi:MAG: hypothetical protein VX642_08870 [Bdellovibrionota bacterium]|nr:hypothetical protein [Bdellovibrionota bacterium]
MNNKIKIGIGIIALFLTVVFLRDRKMKNALKFSVDNEVFYPISVEERGENLSILYIPDDESASDYTRMIMLLSFNENVRNRESIFNKFITQAGFPEYKGDQLEYFKIIDQVPTYIVRKNDCLVYYVDNRASEKTNEEITNQSQQTLIQLGSMDCYPEVI